MVNCLGNGHLGIHAQFGYSYQRCLYVTATHGKLINFLYGTTITTIGVFRVRFCSEIPLRFCGQKYAKVLNAPHKFRKKQKSQKFCSPSFMHMRANFMLHATTFMLIACMHVALSDRVSQALLLVSCQAPSRYCTPYICSQCVLHAYRRSTPPLRPPL